MEHRIKSVAAILVWLFGTIAYGQIPPHSDFTIDYYSDRVYKYVRGNRVLWTDTAGWILYNSEDNGKSVIDSFSFFERFQVQIRNAFLCSNANDIIVTTSSDSLLYYSEDNGRHFYPSLDETTYEPVKCEAWHNPNSIDEGNGVVMFGEYGPDGPHPGNGEMVEYIWRSTNFGKTWEAVFSKNTQTTGEDIKRIRHFHTCRYDPYTRNWLATTGDVGFNIHWFISSDDGETWFEVRNTNSQDYRNLNTEFPDKDTICWATDHKDTRYSGEVDSNYHGGVFKDTWENLLDTSRAVNSTTRVFSQTGQVYNFWYYNKQALFTQVVDSNSSSQPGIFYSSDEGNSWKQVLEWPRTDSNSGGFAAGAGVDNLGRAYIRLDHNLQGYPHIHGIVFTFPNVSSAHMVPMAPIVVSPVGAVGEPRRAEFKWYSSMNASKYHLQTATHNSLDSLGGFVRRNIVLDVTSADTTYGLLAALEANTQYYWHVSAMDSAGESAYSGVEQFTTGTGIDHTNEPNGISKHFVLSQNHPDPFNSATAIDFQVPTRCRVTLKVYDVLGREVATLIDKMMAAGPNQVAFDGSRYASGVYFYTIAASGSNGENFVLTKKMILVK